MCAAPDYNGGDDKSPRRAGITAPCHSFNSDTLSGKVAKFRLSLSPLGPLELSQDKFLSAAPVALSEIPLWPYLLWFRWAVLHLFNSGGAHKGPTGTIFIVTHIQTQIKREYSAACVQTGHLQSEISSPPPPPLPPPTPIRSREGVRICRRSHSCCPPAPSRPAARIR